MLQKVKGARLPVLGGGQDRDGERNSAEDQLSLQESMRASENENKFATRFSTFLTEAL